MGNASHFVVGRNSARELLRAKPNRVKKAYLAEGIKESDERLREIFNLLRKNNLSVERVSKEKISKISGTDSHQGVMLEVERAARLKLSQIISEISTIDSVRILMLDQITDPHNLGAILRASECFGVDYVIATGKNVDITPTVTKVSVGASELVPFLTLGNLAEVISKLKEAGCWIVSAAAEEGAVDISDFDFPQKTVLILGSEGKGVRKLALSRSDYTVKIPLVGQIDSLNVSQAAAVFLSAWQ